MTLTCQLPFAPPLLRSYCHLVGVIEWRRSGWSALENIFPVGPVNSKCAPGSSWKLLPDAATRSNDVDAVIGFGEKLLIDVRLIESRRGRCPPRARPCGQRPGARVTGHVPHPAQPKEDGHKGPALHNDQRKARAQRDFRTRTRCAPPARGPWTTSPPTPGPRLPHIRQWAPPAGRHGASHRLPSHGKQQDLTRKHPMTNDLGEVHEVAADKRLVAERGGTWWAAPLSA